ncbi:hypothetical protein KI387_003476, partial [Taxus chinensis]
MESLEGSNAEEHATKRLKTGSGGWDSSIARTAEIVLFLSGMAQMRGGRVPSIIERGLMDEARQRLGHMAAMLAPRDLVSEDFARDMVGDLGFNRNEDISGNSAAATLGEKFTERKAKLETRIEKVLLLAATATMATSAHTILEQPTAFASPGVAQSVSVASAAPVARPGHLFAQTARIVQPNQIGTPFPMAAPSPIGYPLDLVDQRTRSGKPNEVSSSIAEALLPPATRPATLEARRTVVARFDQASPFPMVPKAPTAHPMALFAQKARMAHSGGVTLPVSVAPVVPTTMSVASQAQTITIPQQDQVSLSIPVPQMSLTPWATVIAQTETTTVARPDQMMPSISMVLAGPVDHPMDLREGTTRMVQSDEMTSPLGTVNSLSAQSQGPSETELFGSMNDHNAIAGAVKQVLQSFSSERIDSQPHSRSYMDAPLPCQICKAIVNDVSSVLICDWCEKAFHVSCHQPYPVKDLPKTEWYCSKCFSASNGKPYPIKYGRVGKRTTFQAGSANKGGLKGASAKFPAK